MFPDLTCDDVFRFETKRLWLRWPRAADAAAIAEFAADPAVAEMIADMAQAYPIREAERFIINARAENAAGCSLHLAITQKAAAGAVVGILSAGSRGNQDVEIGYALLPQVWGKGLATEAVRAAVDLIFNVTPASRIVAMSRLGNEASRRVLEKSGFIRGPASDDLEPLWEGAQPDERFRLDRAMWHRSNALRRMPPMSQQMRDSIKAGAEVPDDNLADPGRALGRDVPRDAAILTTARELD
jgi:RimJ/RimL family protein N-acetyltransferase